MLLLCSSYVAISASLHTLSLIALSINLFKIGFGREAGSFNALFSVISLNLASSSADISFLLRYCGFIAAICIATLVSASLIASLEAPSAATQSPVIFWNLLIESFSPIVRVFSSSSDCISRIAHTSSPSPALSTEALSALSATACTNSWNVAFLATKSVSELTSTTTAVLPSDATLVIPSAAILPAFFSTLAAPLFLRTSTAASISPSVSVRAFLHSIIPAPVDSLSSLTIAAVTAAIILSSNKNNFKNAST